RGKSGGNRSRHLLNLADKARAFELPESLRLSLVHEACHELVKQSETQKAGSEELERVAVTLSQLLPGTEVPIKGDHAKLLASYRKEPVAIYDKSTEADRLIIHRSLFADVARRSIQARLSADVSNGFEVAELLDQRVPEFHEEAETLRNQTLAKRA